MKSSLTDILRCPMCRGHSGFEVVAQEKDNIEMKRGDLLCHICQKRFPIADGIVDLLYDPNPIVAREREAQSRLEEEYWQKDPDHVARLNNPQLMREWVLGLPDINPDLADHADAFRFLLAKLALTGRERVLDLGAGSCWTTYRFAVLGCQCVSLDISYLSFRPARVHIEHGGVYFERVIADMNDLPFQDGSFDLVYSNAAVHHTSKLEATFREIARVLRKGGRVALSGEPMTGIFERGRQREFGQREVAAGVHERAYTSLQWLEAAEAAGLRPQTHLVTTGLKEKIERKARDERFGGPLWRVGFALMRLGMLRWLVTGPLRFPVILLKPFNVAMVAYK